MDLTKIVSISGKSGLFKVVSQGKNAVIVESLSDQKRFPAFGHEKMSSLLPRSACSQQARTVR